MDDLYQDYLLDLAETPLNHGTLDPADSHLTGTNSSCGDQVEVWVNWQGETLADIKWTGQGCIISQAAMSALSEFLKGKTKTEIADLHTTDVLQLLHFDSISPRTTQVCFARPRNSQENGMTIFVGSTNPVKLNAARRACGEQWSHLDIQGIEVVSQIAAQPLSDVETRTGAQNRARAALAAGRAAHPDVTEYLGLGMEGGVFTDQDQMMWSTVWVCVIDADGRLYEANGGRIPVPVQIADGICSGGEMGPVMSQLTGEANIKHKQGMFGVITDNFVTRTDEYSAIAQMAIGQWYGRNWASSLHKDE